MNRTMLPTLAAVAALAGCTHDASHAAAPAAPIADGHVSRDELEDDPVGQAWMQERVAKIDRFHALGELLGGARPPGSEPARAQLVAMGLLERDPIE